MKRLVPISLVLLLSALPSRAAETALSALRALPKADAQNVVRIAARDGLASPEHWYFTVYDPKAPAFLRVLVVAKGEVVTSEDVPAAEAAGLPRELMESTALEIDSDQAASMALSYAAANQAQVSYLDYQLARQGARAVPVWVVTCLDQNVRAVGSVVITAGRGNVVASEGFPIKPEAAPATQAVKGNHLQPVPVEPARSAAGIDPRIAMSDQEFLQSQTRGSSTAPGIAEPPRVDPPVSLEEFEASGPRPWVPPMPAIAESKATKNSRLSKGKATPAPSSRIAGRRELPLEGIPGYVVSEDDADAFFFGEDFDDDRERAYEPPRRRSKTVRVSSGDLPREVKEIRRFIHRILPF